MAKITISDITAAFGSNTAINAKFQQIEDELNLKVLYRDNPVGETNSMSNDIDMAGYNLLNVNNISEFATPSIDADEVVVVPAGNIAAINAQAALEELDAEKPQIFDGKTGAPTVDEDTSNGYKKGDNWIDETNDAAYTCVDHTTGAAVWIQQGTDTGTVTSVGATAPITSSGGANPTVGIVAATGSVPGSMSATDKAKLDALTAATVPIVDAGGYFTGTDVEAVTQEIGVALNVLKTKVIEIGAWPMSTPSSKSVAHGLTLGDIRTVSVLITNDAGTNSYLLDTPLDSSAVYTGTAPAYVSRTNSTDVWMTSITGGLFDHADFSGVSNRGWITIQYI